MAQLPEQLGHSLGLAPFSSEPVPQPVQMLRKAGLNAANEDGFRSDKENVRCQGALATFSAVRSGALVWAMLTTDVSGGNPNALSERE